MPRRVMRGLNEASVAPNKIDTSQGLLEVVRQDDTRLHLKLGLPPNIRLRSGHGGPDIGV